MSTEQTVSIDFLLNYQNALVEGERFKQQIIQKMQEAEGGSEESWSQFAAAAARDFQKAQAAAEKAADKIAKAQEAAAEQAAKAAAKDEAAWEKAFEKMAAAEAAAAKKSAASTRQFGEAARSAASEMFEAAGRLANLGPTNEKIAKVTQGLLQGASAGAKLGSAFGPIGTAAGAALGAVIGWLGESSKEAAALTAAIDKTTDSLRKTTDEAKRFGNEISITKVVADFEDLSDKIDKAREAGAQEMVNLGAIRDAGAAATSALVEGYGDLDFSIRKTLQHLDDMGKKKPLGDLRQAATQARADLEGLQTVVDMDAKALDGLKRVFSGFKLQSFLGFSGGLGKLGDLLGAAEEKLKEDKEQVTEATQDAIEAESEYEAAAKQAAEAAKRAVEELIRAEGELEKSARKAHTALFGKLDGEDPAKAYGEARAQVEALLTSVKSLEKGEGESETAYAERIRLLTGKSGEEAAKELKAIEDLLDVETGAFEAAAKALEASNKHLDKERQDSLKHQEQVKGDLDKLGELGDAAMAKFGQALLAAESEGPAAVKKVLEDAKYFEEAENSGDALGKGMMEAFKKAVEAAPPVQFSFLTQLKQEVTDVAKNELGDLLALGPQLAESFGKAAKGTNDARKASKQAQADIERGLAHQLEVLAAKEAATSISDFADGNLAGGAGHAAAAIAFEAAAALTGYSAGKASAKAEAFGKQGQSGGSGGSSSSSSGSGGGLDGGPFLPGIDNSPITQTPTIINLVINSALPPDQRALEEAGGKIKQAMDAHTAAGGGLV